MAYDRELAERLREQLAQVENVTEKGMFGGLAFLVNGNMAVSASRRGGLLVRVLDEGQGFDLGTHKPPDTTSLSGAGASPSSASSPATWRWSAGN